MASDTPLPPDANKAVAKACGFEWDMYPLDIKKITVDGWVNGVDPFEPDKDPAAALFALTAWCDREKRNGFYFYLPYATPAYRHRCSIPKPKREFHEGDTCSMGETAGHAICLEILAAEKERTK